MPNKFNATSARQFTRIAAILLVAISNGGQAVDLGTASTSDLRASAPSPATLPGQSVTLLPDGRWLLLGGADDGAASARAAVTEATMRRKTDLPFPMPEARVGHTATVIPDGRVLLIGGSDANEEVISAPRLFDPRTGEFSIVEIGGLTPRAEHTATLLTDGRILVAGGISSSGHVRRDAELIDTLTWESQTLDTELDAARFGHLAALMPASSVLLWDGLGTSNQAIPTASLFIPSSESFLAMSSSETAAVVAQLSKEGPHNHTFPG